MTNGDLPGLLDEVLDALVAGNIIRPNLLTLHLLVADGLLSWLEEAEAAAEG